MKNFIVHNKQGQILRNGTCRDVDFSRQAHDGEFLMEGKANGFTQKIVGGGQFRLIVNKDSEEIIAENSRPHVIPIEKRPANITNEQWQNVLSRLKNLEKET